MTCHGVIVSHEARRAKRRVMVTREGTCAVFVCDACYHALRRANVAIIPDRRASERELVPA